MRALGWTRGVAELSRPAQPVARPPGAEPEVGCRGTVRLARALVFMPGAPPCGSQGIGTYGCA